MPPQERAERAKEAGTQAYKNKHYPQAVQHYSEAVDALSSYTPAIFNRAAAYMALKQFSKALDDCQLTLALQKEQQLESAIPKTLARLGKCQLAVGQIDQAGQTLAQARASPSLEKATLNGVLADLAKIDRIRNHLNSIQRSKDEGSWSMVSFGLDALRKEVDVEPVAWKVQRLEALVQRKKYDDATFLAR